MNKFLKKRPDGQNASDEALPSPAQPLSPALKKASTSRWKKSKKAPEVRPQLDLSAALPSTDDFRTSLIMPSLSTRFSMLREQDDPKSLLGKASDDSVLQPRRKSRLADFGFPSSGLADIAEISSLHASLRPPLTHEHREHSYLSEDGYGSDAEALGGGIMSRSRPGEGNVLFGGRQKIYKIPTSGAASTKSLGKLVYDDDIGYSAFQKYRQKEREEDESHFARPSNDSQGFDFGLDKGEPDDQDDDGQRSLLNDSAKDLSHSPSLSSFDRKRSTTSSDAHSIARSSTAATSITSQPALSSAAPSPAYAPATVMTPAPAASSVMDRSNMKARRLYEQGLDQHIQEQQSSAITRLNSIQRQHAMSGKKTPPFLQSTKSAGNLQDRVHQPVYALRGQSPPLSSPLPPQLNSAGPVRHANSASPSPVPSGPQSPIESQYDESNSAFQQRPNRYEDDQSEYQPNTSPDLSARATSHAESMHEPSKAYTVFQNAVNQFPVKSPPSSINKSTLPDTHRTFFGNISASEDEDEEEVSEIAKSFNQPEYGYGGYQSKWQPTPLPSVSEHPALREEKSSLAEDLEDEGQSKSHLRQKASARSLRHVDAKAGALVPRELDSPTLGPQSQALNGMVHHLRQKSNNSSIYPVESGIGAQQEEAVNAPWNSGSALDTQHASMRSSHCTASTHYTASNPWDMDESNSGASSAVDRPESRSEISGFQEGAASDRVSEVPSVQSSVPSWQRELQKQHHTRDPSNATLQDREAFSRDLAARRDAIRENLKSYVETNNPRAASPVPGAAGPLRAFGIMRAKSSGESLGTMRDQHSKGSKGLGANSNASVTSLTKDERSGFSLDLARPRGNSSPRSAMPPPVSQHPAFKNEIGESARDTEIGELPKERQLASSRSPALTAARNRSRSNSTTTTDRSRSRTSPYRDDLEKAMIEGHGSSATAHEPSPEASPAMLPSDRDSNGSRTNMQPYFDQKMGLAAQNMSRLALNGPQAVPLQPNVYTPGRPAPVANAYTSNPTPPLSTSSNGTPAPASPATFSPEEYSPIIPSSSRPSVTLRRKTVSKSEISEPILISSTSNVDTVDLPPGASLKNGIDQPPPIPPINPRRRGTRKLFGLVTSKDASDKETELPMLTQSDPNLLHETSSPCSDRGLFPPSNVVRIPARQESPALEQYGFNRAESPERRGPTRAVTAPMGAGEVGMF
ncbi:uncharacterized protein MYCFIDRAFT_217084 [Pseudocercospora fijiensis CIRAD86]|uniref:Uncharacterized protein n=1 Tax=Pseudocercospora fijiensis (strain CIRAD86) TaxID=383855 RepID=M3AJU8_PSEFD|nr:uncharacterized protein MYCFIDRAFT_217084 [Pseudocercospora fijiensis CIRAD86]EME77448.1 hypothetical protein MYCFIDRAFT_217084 [Pseudocercospora fijiensis CIRAD86]